MTNLGCTRRTFLMGAGAAATAGLTSAATTRANALAVSAADFDPAVGGAWSAPIGIGGQAIHATLTRTGEVMFFSYIEGNPTVDHTSYAGTFNPVTGDARPATLSYHRDVFCAGMNVLPDGRVFVAGGHDPHTGKRSDPNGVFETDFYDPMDRSWTPGPLLSESRWYPTNVGMASGRAYVFGGGEDNSRLSVTVDSYNPATNTITKLPSTANKAIGMYPRMHLMPNGRVVRTGPAQQSWFFDPAANQWSAGPNMSVKRTVGSSVLLAGASKVLAFGGRTSSTAPPLATAEVLDLTAATPRWQTTGSLNFGRIHANAVVLPDGMVMAFGGGTRGTVEGPQRAAEMYDPATGRWTVMASAVGSRMYHSTALLLPDGRVFTGGTVGPHANTAELYSPPYLFRGARPRITSAGSTVARGGTLPVSSPEAAQIRSIALIHPSSTTHQVDTDQRHLPLAFTVSGDNISARLPANTMLTPPGYYMLFLVDGNGVPSVASWVKVT